MCQMYRIIPYKKEHIDCMDVREHETHLLDDQTLAGLDNGFAFTGIHSGRIIACFGLIPYHSGNAEIWQIPSVYVKNHIIDYCKYTKEWLSSMAYELQIRRMETLCLDDKLHTRWMTFLGFESEGVKRQWIGQDDYRLWGKIWN